MSERCELPVQSRESARNSVDLRLPGVGDERKPHWAEPSSTETSASGSS